MSVLMFIHFVLICCVCVSFLCVCVLVAVSHSHTTEPAAATAQPYCRAGEGGVGHALLSLGVAAGPEVGLPDEEGVPPEPGPTGGQ